MSRVDGNALKTGFEAVQTLKIQKTSRGDWSWTCKLRDVMAEPTGLEPATSDVTGRRSNQLNYDSAKNSKR